MNINFLQSKKKKVDTSETVDPMATKGIDKKSVMIIAFGTACLITTILIMTKSGERTPVMATASADVEVDPTYGGIWDIPSETIVDQTPPSPADAGVPPDWAATMGLPFDPSEQGDERQKQFLAAVRGGGGLFLSKKKERNSEEGPDGSASPPQAQLHATDDRTIIEGTTIDAVLETALNSDRPGPVSARILHDVTDTKTLSNILIPEGTRVLGNMSPSGHAIALTWHRLIFPDGKTMMLDQLPSIDTDGGGVAGTVDRHRMARVGSSVMMALLGATTAIGGAQLSDQGGTIGGALALQLGPLGGRTMQQVRRPPTVEVPAGHAFQIWVTQDLRF